MKRARRNPVDPPPYVRWLPPGSYGDWSSGRRRLVPKTNYTLLWVWPDEGRMWRLAMTPFAWPGGEPEYDLSETASPIYDDRPSELGPFYVDRRDFAVTVRGDPADDRIEALPVESLRALGIRGYGMLASMLPMLNQLKRSDPEHYPGRKKPRW